MVDAEAPGLEVGDDAVDPGQDDVGRHLADDVGLVLVADGAVVVTSRPAWLRRVIEEKHG